MSAEHTVTAELDGDGDLSWFNVRFACSGGPGDLCHQWCAEGCEEECTATPILSGADVELVAMAPLDGHRWAPDPAHGESCRIVDWLDAGGADETYGDDWRDEPLRAGTHRIEEEWDGDTYLWRYAEPAPVTASAS